MMPTSNPYGLRVGQRVRTTMGIPTAGRVVRYVPRNQYTDGQYRFVGNPPKWERKLGVPERHQLRIARDTLKMNDAMVGVMGGPTKAEALEIIRRYELMYGRNPGQSLEEVKRLAKIRHEKERKAARRRGRKDFPMLPYECSWAFEEEFKRKHGRNPELLIVGNPPPQAFDVYLNGKLIDTVSYGPNVKVDAEEVRRSLINHDGYDHRIVVRKTRKGRNPMRRQRRRSRNSWKGHRAAHRKAALKGWRRRRRSRKGRKKYAKSGKKFIRFGGQKISWKGLVRRKGVKGAMKIWRKRRKIGGRR